MRREIGGVLSGTKVIFFADYFGDETKVPSTSFIMICEQYDSDEKIILANPEILNGYAVLLNSSWSQTCKQYEIRLNCKDAYTDMDPNLPTWLCKYIVRGRAGVSTYIIGYGDTPEDALRDCQDIFSLIQERYNPRGESV